MTVPAIQKTENWKLMFFFLQYKWNEILKS